MSARDDGGPAFPTTDMYLPGRQVPAQTGMTLRDYFAAQALAGLLVNPSLVTPDAYAKAAYRVADAMLATRKAT